jgi:branched-chain amino acid transport system permease protein
MTTTDSPQHRVEDETTVFDPLPDEDATTVIPAVVDKEEERPFRPSASGWVGRGAVWALLVWVVLALPANVFSPFELGVSDIGGASTAAIFAIVALSLNVLLGYAGQISLGHQAFVGIGAFTAGFVVTDLQLGFWIAVLVAAVLGACQAALLGAISLRVSGLYFALVTLAYGFFAEETLFGIAALTGGEGGKPVARPIGFESETRFYFLSLGFLALVLWLDWRLTRSKAGRALQALRENPRVASSYGINVNAYIMVAFVVSGVFAGIAGALFAHHEEVIVGSHFSFQLALFFVLMTVVGGLRDRVGIVVGAVFMALLYSGKLVKILHVEGFVEGRLGLPSEFVALVVGPILLLLTLTAYPGGIGQQVAPIRLWLTGRRFDIHAGAVKEVVVNDVRA